MTTLVDYICPDYTLMIKPHSKDRWQNYGRIFPDAKLIEKSFPSELLPFTADGELELALTASSTSIRGVAEFAKRSYYFTMEIETHRDRIDDMYVAVEVLKEIGIKDGVCVRNINETQIINFLDNSGIKTDGEEILIDSGISKQCNTDVSDYRLALCLNLGNVLNFNPKNNIDTLFIISADIIPREGSLAQEKRILIFAYCNDGKTAEKLLTLKMARKLKYTKAEINISCKKAENESFDRLTAKLMRDLEWEEN
ncbi:MAG: hypothetical protein LUF33_06085 [Clostridiales bacterium]|nr:hypothetical protein [Clostridiales bacterium]